jgi:hypothetical protein
MELHEKTRDELEKLAEEYELKLPPKIGDEKLRKKIELAAIARRVKIETQERERLQLEAQIRKDIAEIKATAEIGKITITIPDKPTIDDVVRLKKEVGIKAKEPKPSPETLAIRNSKKVYATFVNREEDDVDVRFNVGGQNDFHLWPDKLHILPEWLIRYCRRKCIAPLYEDKPDPVSGVPVSVKVGSKPRFSFEILGDAPKDARASEAEEFGVVLDEEIISKILKPEEQLV